jgi:hypothetical protein
MYRFPADLDLSYLVGREIAFIGLDVNSIYFNMQGGSLSEVISREEYMESCETNPDVHITVSGPWSLATGSGAIVDELVEHCERESYRIHVLLGLKMLGYAVVSDTTLQLNFERGYILTVVDDSPYENFSVEYGDTFIVA